MSASVESEEVEAGDRIGRYTVLRRLATGGMAEIYLARQDGPKGFTKLVVLKRVLAGYAQTEKFVAMFLDEGRLSARLSHPNIAQTFDLGEHEGAYHLAMEYVPGESLARLVRRASSEGKGISANAVLRIGMQVLEALEYAHDLKGERGEWLKVVHRDVSPTNVIISYHGSVKLLDFGIARAASHQHETQIGMVKGKGGYMSPEQAVAGPIDQRTDVYAVGALLYLLSTGIGPFDDEDSVFSMMQAAVEARFPRPSERNRGIDPQLEQIILKAMATRPDDRYSTAGVMLTQLEQHAAQRRLSAGPRELGTLMRQLFPAQAELALSSDPVSDAAIAKLAESFIDLNSDDVVNSPPRPTRRAAPRSDEPATEAQVSSMDSIGLDQTVVPRTNLPPTRAMPTPKAVSPAPPPRPVKLDERPAATQPVRGGAVAERVGSLAGPVPMMAPDERDTPVVAIPFPLPGDEEKTHGQFDPKFTLPRTISSEQAFSGVIPDSNTEAHSDLGSQTVVTAPTTFLSVADLVSRNPWAFVGAGLGAVLVGVLLLWLLWS